MSLVSSTNDDFNFAAAETLAREATGKGVGGNVIFIKASSCPLTLLPLGTVTSVVTVYDEQTRRSRRPQSGELGSRKFLFYGADATGQVGIYCCGPMLIGEIAKLLKTAQGLGKSRVYVTLKATGAGKETRYSAELNMEMTNSPKVPLADIRIPAGIRTLESAGNWLLGDPSPAPAVAPAAAPATVPGKDLPW